MTNAPLTITENLESYALCIALGAQTSEQQHVLETGLRKSAKIVRISPKDLTEGSISTALIESGLKSYDFRTRALVLLSDDLTESLVLYSVILGFANRRLDAYWGGRLLIAEFIYTAYSSLTGLKKPDPVPVHIQVGNIINHNIPSLYWGSVPNGVTKTEAVMITYAKRVRVVPYFNILDTLEIVLIVGSIRSRGSQEKLPFIVIGDEPATLPENFDEVVGLCLDNMRYLGSSIRANFKKAPEEEPVQAEPPTKHQQLLIDSAETSIEKVLLMLGASKDPETEFWHCPRPERHANGDKNASVAVVDGKIRCMRCDAEPVDSIRIVMDTLNATPDEAAYWLVDIEKVSN